METFELYFMSHPQVRGLDLKVRSGVSVYTNDKD